MKIFCIGFNKTGTTSLHSLFTEMDMSSYHGMYSDWELNDPRFDQYQCFSDGEHHNFVGLDRKYPGSKFILTSRSLDNWLVSRVRHIDIRKAANKTGWMRKQYEEDPKGAIEHWARYRKPYHDSIYKYFNNRPNDLFSLNICDNHNQQAEVSELLKFLGICSETMKRFPHQRKTEPIAKSQNSSIKAFILRKYKPRSHQTIRLIVEETLHEIGIPQSQWKNDDLHFGD